MNRRQPCASDIHGPADDECLGARCITGLPREIDTNPWFSGSTALTGARGLTPDEMPPTRPTICSRHGGPLDYEAGMRHPCWECSMEMDEADRDRNER